MTDLEKAVEICRSMPLDTEVETTKDSPPEWTIRLSSGVLLSKEKAHFPREDSNERPRRCQKCRRLSSLRATSPEELLCGHRTALTHFHFIVYNEYMGTDADLQPKLKTVMVTSWTDLDSGLFELYQTHVSNLLDIALDNFDELHKSRGSDEGF